MSGELFKGPGSRMKHNLYMTHPFICIEDSSCALCVKPTSTHYLAMRHDRLLLDQFPMPDDRDRESAVRGRSTSTIPRVHRNLIVLSTS